jgi:hypothetical protein
MSTKSIHFSKRNEFPAIAFFLNKRQNGIILIFLALPLSPANGGEGGARRKDAHLIRLWIL